MNSQIFYAAAQIAMTVATLILFFVGFSIVVKALKTESDEDEKKAKRIFMRSFKRSMCFLAGGLTAYAGTKFCSNASAMTAEGYGLFEIAVQSLIQAVLTAGFLLVIPYILIGWKFNTGRKKQSR